MNPMQRLRATLDGEMPERPLNFDIMMTFAAHHAGLRLRDYYLDHRALTQANYRVVEDFDIDIVQAISDPYREAADLGCDVEFPEDDQPLLSVPMLEERSSVARLRHVDPGFGRRMSDRLAALRDFRSQVGGEIPIMGWVEGAMAEAADLRGVSAIMIDVTEDAAWVHELLEFCTVQEISFAQAQVDAGADIIGIGDAVTSLISPAMYREFALPYQQRIVDAVHARGALARLHICGRTTHLLAEMAQTGADIIDVDSMVPFELAAATVAPAAICGNINPVTVMLQGTPDDVIAGTLDCRARGGDRFIGMAGCEVPDATPAENLRAQSRALAMSTAA